MRKILIAIGLTAVLAAGIAAPAHAAVFYFEYTLDDTDPTDLGPWPGCSAGGDGDIHYHEIASFTVTADGNYTFSPSDNPAGFFGLYSQPIDFSDVLTGCEKASDVLTTANLYSGDIYWLYLSSNSSRTVGLFQLSVTGPGDVINAPLPTTTVTSAPSTATVGTAVALTATVTGNDPTGEVEFFDGATSLGTATLTGGTATLPYTPTAKGTLTITAVYSGDIGNVTSTSGPITLTVSAATGHTDTTSPKTDSIASGLADTGADSAAVTLGGLTLLLAGASLLLARRRLTTRCS